ncbi:MAG: DUF885 family protein [Gemmatimonadota bacterium]
MLELDRLCGSTFDLFWHFDPAAASAAGFVSEDARLGRFDAEAIRAHFAAFRATAAAIEELEIEDLPDEIDRTALLEELRVTIARLDEDRPPARDPGFWLSHLAAAIAALLLRPDDAGTSGPRAQAAADRIAAIPGFLDDARTMLTRPPLLLLDGALGTLGPLGELLVHAAAVFGAAAPGGADALNQAVAAALHALARFGHWLRSEAEPEPDIKGIALGAGRFDRRIHHRYAVRSGSAEMRRYAERLMAETERALAEQTAQLGLAGSWRDAVMKLDATGAGSVSAMGDEIERARAFLQGRGFAEVPPRGPDLAQLPPALAALMPGVTYLPGIARLVVAPAPRSRFAIAPLVAAEALPGRHLQELAARAAGSEVRRRLRSPAAVEGWALYAEELMEELGFSAPEGRLIRLARLLEAAARLAADVGLHAAGMTPGGAISLLADRAGLDRADAEAEVRRIVAHPTDASAAAIGRREILAFRSAAGARAGDAAALERFHRTLLAFGALPPGLAGWGMGIER